MVSGLAAGGCSYQLHSLLAKDEAGADQTAALGAERDSTAHRAADVAKPSEVDLAYARAAASQALARDGKDASTPWQNPDTGAGGNITPLTTSYTDDGGQRCRDFLASYAHGDSQDWLQGAACRTSAGNWEVKSLKPLKPS